MLADTGIRVLREKLAFTTPNVFPARAFEQADVSNDPDFREVIEPQHCYVCKELYSGIHPFYDQLCPACGGFNFRKKRSETLHESERPSRPPHRQAIKIGYQARIKLLRAGAPS